MNCPRCAYEHCVKNGKAETQKQRYKCKSCGISLHALHRGVTRFGCVR